MNTNLNRAKDAKNDEFYTQLPDIERELKHYREHFKGKVVYCNCDDPTWSNFFKYFSLNFKKLGLKRLITTCYSGKNENSMPACQLVYDGEQEGNEPDLSRMNIQFLEGDGDFRSPECVELLKEADIVVTNPPFSLFREYVDQLVRYKKQFLIIGNDNAITYKDTFNWIKENKIWRGYGKVKEFSRPDGLIQKFGNIGWYTNLDIAKRHEEFVFTREYIGNEQSYPKYDGYDAINIDKVKDIPSGYNGIMGVPINFLDRHNPTQFTILGAEEFQDIEVEPRVFQKPTHKLEGSSRLVYKRIWVKRNCNED